ncbi:YncE family protein [Zymobacter palmae]|uniref:Uncharacterized conserved protein n=1 Tax=Zymobacter palmae TaxID=33074 RepID=A0A348HI52_9GAMM|nr:hypothetical protein [Zymobacter palmae]BBG31304.1 uncharacterized conserved protein [Zymobacter palmae]
MRLRHIGFALLATGLSGLPVVQQAAATPAVTTKESHLQRQSLGQGVYEVAYSARHHELYVALAGNLRDPQANKGLIQVLDPDTLALKRTITLPLRAFSLALDDSRNRLYVGHTLDAAVSIIDMRQDIRDDARLRSTITVATKAPTDKYFPVHPRELRLSDDGNRLYMSAVAGDGNVYVIDTQQQKLMHTIEHMGKWTSGLALDDAHQRLFVSNADGHVIELSTQTFAPRATFDAGIHPVNITYDSATQRLYAADSKGHRVLVLDVNTRHPAGQYPTVATLDHLQGPLALLIDAARQRLYVTDRDGGQLNVYALSERQASAPIAQYPLKVFPNSLASDPRSGALFVTIKQKLHDDLSLNGQEAIVRIAHP